MYMYMYAVCTCTCILCIMYAVYVYVLDRKLKVTPPNNGYKCDITSPALIKAIVKSGFSEPKINLKKVDTSKSLSSTIYNSVGIILYVSALYTVCTVEEPM